MGSSVKSCKVVILDCINWKFFAAEMGADFNILEYADPELDKVGGGEKTNIFDDDEFEEEDSKKDSG